MGRRLTILLYVMAMALLALSSAGVADAQQSNTQRYNQLQKAIKEEAKKLDELKGKEHVTLYEIEQTNRRLGDLRREMEGLNSRVSATHRKVDDLRRETRDLESRLMARKEWLRKRLKAINRYGTYGDELLVLGSAEDMAALSRRLRYLDTMASSERKLIEDYIKSLNRLNEQKRALDNLLSEVKREEESVRKTSEQLSAEKNRKMSMLNNIRRQKSTYQEVLKGLNAAAERLQKLIKESEKRSDDNFKGYASGNFKNQRRRLPWPVKGKVAIPYGTHNDPQFKTPVFRNGIYVAAAEEAVVQAVYNGKVVFADWFEGYGKLVIVNHGDGYHTLYANLSEIFLKPGDIIKGREQVGRVGTSSLTDRPSLYFEIRYKGKPLDPALWLTR